MTRDEATALVASITMGFKLVKQTNMGDVPVMTMFTVLVATFGGIRDVLRQNGHDDLADEVLAAASVLHDKVQEYVLGLEADEAAGQDGGPIQ